MHHMEDHVSGHVAHMQSTPCTFSHTHAATCHVHIHPYQMRNPAPFVPPSLLVEDLNGPIRALVRTVPFFPLGYDQQLINSLLKRHTEIQARRSWQRALPRGVLARELHRTGLRIRVSSVWGLEEVNVRARGDLHIEEHHRGCKYILDFGY